MKFLEYLFQTGSSNKKNNMLRKLYFKRKYKEDYKKFLPLLDNENYKYHHKNVTTFDTCYLPLSISNKTVTNPNFIVRVYKNYYTVESPEVTDTATTSNNTNTNISHANWTRRVNDSDGVFLSKAKKTIKQYCQNNKFFINPSLVSESNHFLLSEKFKCNGGSFTSGDDEYSFYYSRKYVDNSFIINKDLQTSFVADYDNTTEIFFSNDTNDNNKNKDMYATLRCRLVIKPYEDDNENNKNNYVDTCLLSL